MNLTEVCVRKPVLAWMMMAATIVFGIVAIGRIGISQFPDVDFPTINVSVVWEGAAPEVMENDVIEVLEEALAQTEGMRSLTSVSRMGLTMRFTGTSVRWLNVCRSMGSAA